MYSYILWMYFSHHLLHLWCDFLLWKQLVIPTGETNLNNIYNSNISRDGSNALM